MEKNKHTKISYRLHTLCLSRHVLETCTYKVMYQSIIYYLASPVWQLFVPECCICKVLYCVYDHMHTAKQKLDLNGMGLILTLFQDTEWGH